MTMGHVGRLKSLTSVIDYDIEHSGSVSTNSSMMEGSLGYVCVVTYCEKKSSLQLCFG